MVGNLFTGISSNPKRSNVSTFFDADNEFQPVATLPNTLLSIPYTLLDESLINIDSLNIGL